LAMACCYLFLIVLGVDWRIGLIGAIGFGLSTYYIDLAEAGHSTKMVALAYVPGVYAGAILAFRGRYLLGGGLFAFFLSLNLYSNHYQITFYMFLSLAILGLVELIKSVREQTLPQLLKTAGILSIAVVLGLASNLSRIWPTQEYAKETIRGKSELKANADKGDGLTKDYIFDWSYGKIESLTLLIPNFYGGGASQHFRGTKTHNQVYRNVEAQLIQGGNSREAAKKSAEQQVASLFYWGTQPFVGVAIYFGAILLLLFLVGAFLVKGTLKQWLLLSAIFALTLAWGKNFFLNPILVDYFPLFNKFRAVSMALGLSHLAVIVLAMLGLHQLMDKTLGKAQKLKALYWATGILGGICLLVLLMGGSLDLTGKNDARFGEQLASLLREDRLSVMRADAIRSLVLILVGAGLIWAYVEGKIKALVMVGLIGLVSVGEVWMVNKRILFAEKYETKQQLARAVQARQIDLDIQKDTDPHYRVLDLSRGNPFVDATTSYFHKSIGGYHAAKLIRFQEVVERYLSNPLAKPELLGMLNTKYVVQGQGGEVQASRNPQALGNAWFVDGYQLVPDADAEIDALANLDPAREAVIQQQYADLLNGLTIQRDSNAQIRLTSYHPDVMTYEYSAASDQLAVFSEIYYPADKGWKLFVDGEPLHTMVKANYLLRAARLPAGQNRKLEMRFEPRSFYLGETIALISSLLVLIALGAGLYFYFTKYTLPDADQLAEVVSDPKPSRKPTIPKTKKATTKSKESTDKANKTSKKKPNKKKR
ncbi:MAG: hypothetical protein AAGD05_00145, partial [Bacteroidota bacterium]